MTDRDRADDTVVGALESLARRGFDMVQVDPVTASRMLKEVLGERVASPTARVTAQWGLGRLAHDRGAIDDALTVYTEAVRLATDTGLQSIAAEVRVSWAVCLQANGDTDAALAQLELAEPLVAGASLGRLRMQRGYLLTVLGDRERAVAEYDAALPLLTAAGDELAAARLISNRGVVFLQLGRIASARADFERSETIAARLGQHVLAAGALHNLAYLDAHLGRFPAALRGFAAARAEYAAVGSPGRYLGALDIDECEVLLEAGLAAEAAALAARVVTDARDTGNVAQVAEGLLLLARGRLAMGEVSSAAAAADEAAELFARARRRAWEAQARYIGILAHAGADEGPNSAARRFVRLRRVADQLEQQGWASEAAEVRVLTGRLALAAGRRDVAEAVLTAAAAARRHPLARVRAEAFHAAALLHLSGGDRGAARRALASGLRSVDQYRATLGATELRSHAARLGEPLAALGLRLALDQRDGRTVLQWAERWRSGSLGVVGERGGTAVFDAIADLRGARRRLTAAQLDRTDDVAALGHEVATLEAGVTRLSRHQAVRRGSAPPTAVAGAIAARLQTALDDATLVEFVESDGELVAVIVGGSRRGTHLVTLGPTASALQAHQHLVFALRRMANMTDQRGVERAIAAYEIARREVDGRLLGPVANVLGDGALVIVPTGALHSVLWGALPTAQRAGSVVVAPSAEWWLRGVTAGRRKRVLLVAGPGLQHGDDELQALARLHPSAEVLSGRAATVGSVLAAMERATVAHVAAHGVFRADNPLFSTLQLHDGPLFVHELEALRRVPTTVVLTACSSGRYGVLPGDELLGTSAALMSLGVREVVAPLLPIADRAAVHVATDLHRGLAKGWPLATSLNRCVTAAQAAGLPDVMAAAASFTCVAARK